MRRVSAVWVVCVALGLLCIPSAGWSVPVYGTLNVHGDTFAVKVQILPDSSTPSIRIGTGNPGDTVVFDTQTIDVRDIVAGDGSGTFTAISGDITGDSASYDTGTFTDLLVSVLEGDTVGIADGTDTSILVGAVDCGDNEGLAGDGSCQTFASVSGDTDITIFDSGNELGNYGTLDFDDNLTATVVGDSVIIDASTGGGGGSGTFSRTNNPDTPMVTFFSDTDVLTGDDGLTYDTGSNTLGVAGTTKYEGEFHRTDTESIRRHSHTLLSDAPSDSHHAQTTSSDIHHGDVTGLSDDDHTQYLRSDANDTSSNDLDVQGVLRSDTLGTVDQTLIDLQTAMALPNANFLEGYTSGGSAVQVVGVTASDVVLLGDVSGQGLNTQIEANGTVGLDVQIGGNVNVDNGHLRINADNNEVEWGAGQDASISYDGTNLVINPQDVGSGNLNLEAGDFDHSGTTIYDAGNSEIDAGVINDADIDHGNTTGLGDDDHTDYLRSDTTALDNRYLEQAGDSATAEIGVPKPSNDTGATPKDYVDDNDLRSHSFPRTLLQDGDTVAWLYRVPSGETFEVVRTGVQTDTLATDANLVIEVQDRTNNAELHQSSDSFVEGAPLGSASGPASIEVRMGNNTGGALSVSGWVEYAIKD